MIQIDMDIPKTCDDCPFHVYHSGKNYVCVATPLFYPMNLANYKDGRKDFCPLIQVEQESTTKIEESNFSQEQYLADIQSAYDCGKSVLDKVRADILDCLKALDEIERSGLNIYLPNEISGRRLTYQQCLGFIDKYKAETEDT